MRYEISYHLDADTPEQALALTGVDKDTVVFITEVPDNEDVRPTTYRMFAGGVTVVCEENEN